MSPIVREPQTSSLLQLPDEILVRILEKLTDDFRSVARVRQVCYRLNHVATDGHLWRALVVQHFPLARQVIGGAFERFAAWHKPRIHSICLSGHKQPVTNLSLTQDGRLMSSGSGEKKVVLWNAAEERPSHASISSGKKVSSFATQNQACFIGGSDGSIQVWNLQTHACTHTLKGHSDWVTAVALSPNGKWLFSGGRNGTLRLWQLPHLQLIASTEKTNKRCHPILAFSPNNQWIVAGLKTTLQVWDSTEHKLIANFQEHSKSITCMAFSRDSRWLVSGGEDKNIFLWSLDSMELAMEWCELEKVTSLSISPDGLWLAVGLKRGGISLYHLGEKQCAYTFSTNKGDILSLLFFDHVTLFAGTQKSKLLKVTIPLLD